MWEFLSEGDAHGVGPSDACMPACLPAAPDKIKGKLIYFNYFMNISVHDSRACSTQVMLTSSIHFRIS